MAEAPINDACVFDERAFNAAFGDTRRDAEHVLRLGVREVGLEVAATDLGVQCVGDMHVGCCAAYGRGRGGGPRAAGRRRRRGWRMARTGGPMPHGHHGGRDVHVVSRTGTDVVGVPDVVRRPADLAECDGRSSRPRHLGPRPALRWNSVLGQGSPPPSMSMSLYRTRNRPGTAQEQRPSPRSPRPGARNRKRRRPRGPSAPCL